MELHGELGCIWRLCASYCNLNEITIWFKYPFWRFDNVLIHPGKAKKSIKKGENQLFGAKTGVMFDFKYQE